MVKIHTIILTLLSGGDSQRPMSDIPDPDLELVVIVAR